MLCQAYIILKDSIIYQRNFGKGLDNSLFLSILPKIRKDAFSDFGSEIGSYDFFRYRVSYLIDKDYNLMFIFVSGLTDDFDDLKVQLDDLKKVFLDFYRNSLKKGLGTSIDEDLNPILDQIHRNLAPKISLVGFAGVGKSTITKLIKSEELPTEHIPTISGVVSTIQLGKLYFYLWDFAGQEQFNYLWVNFIKESDAVLLITDSSFENVEKSKFFIDLIKQEAPYSHYAIIGNKQDLATSIKIETIESLTGLKGFPMVAINPENKVKMIRIIANILEIDPEVSPLMRPFFEKEKLIVEVQKSLDSGNLDQALSYYKRISELCIEIGDGALAEEYQEKTINLQNLKNQRMSVAM